MDHLAHFKQLCQQHGHFTRLVACALPLEYAIYESRHESEYLQLGQTLCFVPPPWEVFYGKGREDVILKALSEIYSKLDRLERLIHEQQASYLPLEHQATLGVLGHGILGVTQDLFEPPMEYYMRFKLPHMPYKRIGLVAKAFDPKLLHITRMHAGDIRDFDGYIAKRELESLKKAH